MARIVMVSGSNAGDPHLTPKILSLSEDVGFSVAKRGGIVLCGGLGGVMEAACRGAKRGGGLTVGILPRGREEANPFVDVPIATHLGYLRNALLVNAADSLIAICGRWGTLNEIAFAVSVGKPAVLLSVSGGVSAWLADAPAVAELGRQPAIARTVEEAVDRAFAA